MRSVTETIKKNWSIFFVATILFCWLLFVLFRGQSLYAYVWDNLDGAVPQLKMLGDNGLFFSWDGEVPFLNGLSRKYLYFSEFQLYNLLYAVLPSFVAYQAAWFLRPLITISGSIFFGKSVLKEKYENYKHIIILAAFAYSWMPVIPMQSFAIVSIPWFLGWIYNFYKTPNWKYALGLFLFPMLSDMSRIGIFLCGYTVLFFIIEAIVTRKPKWHLLLAVAVLAIGYFCVEWRIVYIMVSGTETNRETYAQVGLSAAEAWSFSKGLLKHGPVHAMTLQKYVLTPWTYLVLFIRTVSCIRKKKIFDIIKDRLFWVVAIIWFNTIIAFLDSYTVTKNWIASIVPLLGGITLANVTWLNCCLWTLAFSIACIYIYDIIGKRIYIVSLLALLVIPCTSTNEAYYNDIGMNLRGFIYELRNGKTYDNLFTYEEYYAEELFETIKEDINYNGEYSYAYCLEPSVLEYNQIKTVDGNCNFYPKSFKEIFARLLAPVFEVRHDYKEAFETKGIYLFLFSPDIDHEAKKDIGITESQLMVDKDALYELGGKYIFSRVIIPNADDLELTFLKHYEDDNTPYEIYLYKMAE